MIGLLLSITHNGKDTPILATLSTVGTIWKETPGRKHRLCDLVLNFSQGTMQQQQGDMGPDELLVRQSSVSKWKKSISLLFVYCLPLLTAISDCTPLLWCGKDFAISKGLSVLYQLAMKGYHAWARTSDEGKRALPEEHLKQ